jgi:hypothetical protein
LRGRVGSRTGKQHKWAGERRSSKRQCWVHRESWTNLKRRRSHGAQMSSGGTRIRRKCPHSFYRPPCGELWNLLKFFAIMQSFLSEPWLWIQDSRQVTSWHRQGYALVAGRYVFQGRSTIKWIATCLELLAHWLAEVLRKIRIMLGRRIGLSAKVTKICFRHLWWHPLVPSHRRETLYYITGWLLCLLESRLPVEKGSCLQKDNWTSYECKCYWCLRFESTNSL